MSDLFLHTLNLNFLTCLKKQGTFPCFSFCRFSLRLSVLFFSFLYVLTQPALLQAIETKEGMAARQEAGLRDFAASDSTPTFVRIITHALQQTHQEDVNQYLALLEPNQLNFSRVTVLFRLLLEDQTEERVKPATRVTLGDTLSEYMKTSLPLLHFDPQDQYQSESVQLAKPMILLSWCWYVERNHIQLEWFPETVLQNEKEAQTKKLHALLDRWIRKGFMLRGSYEYISLLTSLIHIYDLSQDSTLKTKVISLAEIIITEMALENIDGLWGTIRQNAYTLLSPSSTKWVFYLFFGSHKPSVVDDIDPGILILCQTSYRLPPLLERLGREHTHRGIFESKQRYQTYTHSLDQVEEVRKYSYVTPYFILSSFQLREQTVPWQARPWDLLLWNEQRHNTHVVSFNGEQLFSGKEPTDETAYTIWNATTLQHKNVLFSQYNKSSRFMILDDAEKEVLLPNYEQLPTRVWIPNSLAPIEQANGWQFIHAGKVYIALRPLPGKSYWWRTAEAGSGGSEAAAILGFRDLYAGMIMEVEAESTRISSFYQFKQQVLEAPLVIDPDSVTFVSRRGDVYYFPRSGGEFLVNGKRINAQTDKEYEWFSNPFVQSTWDSGLFKAKWNPFSLLIDIRDPNHPIRHIHSN